MPLSPRARLIAIPVACVVAAALLIGPVILAQLMLGDGQRFAPEVDGWIAVVMGVAFLGTPAVLLVLLATVGRRALAARSRRFKAMYAIGTVALQLAAVTALGVGAIMSDPSFLGTNRAGSCATAPDGARRACLYEGGMICGYEVYVGPRDGYVLRLARSITKKCSDVQPGAQVRWGGPGGDETKVLGADGAELASEQFLLLPQVH